MGATARLDQAQTLPLCRCGWRAQLKYVRHGFSSFESREAPLLSTQDTYITAVQFLSARYYCCCCECKTSNIVRLWASPAVGSAYGRTPNSGEQATQATTRSNSNGSDTPVDKRPGSFCSQYTRGAHSDHYPASLRTYAFASLSSFFSSLPESLGRWPNRVYCCLTPTCVIRQRQRRQAELEGAMVRATIQTHSRITCSPECAVDPNDQRIPVERVQSYSSNTTAL